MDEPCGDGQTVAASLRCAAEWAGRAVQFDTEGATAAAVYHYSQAAGALLAACRLVDTGSDEAAVTTATTTTSVVTAPATTTAAAVTAAATTAAAVSVTTPSSGDEVADDNFGTCGGEVCVNELRQKADQYLSRAEALSKQQERCAGGTGVTVCRRSAEADAVERVSFLLSQALSEDEAAQSVEALELYTEAVQLYLTQEKCAAVLALRSAIDQAMSRAEYLKSQLTTPTPTAPPSTDPLFIPSSAATSDRVRAGAAVPSCSTHSVCSSSAAAAAAASNNSNNSSGSSSYKSSQQQLSSDELHVLAVTSRVNNRVYVPFIAEADCRERFGSAALFVDPDGLLQLSAKQQQQLHSWRRPAELFDRPCVVQSVPDCFSIRQTCVSDCSFVASLAVSALYERRFHRRLITDIIYPRSRTGPVYNPSGKYMVRLYVNGVSRKVIIDDQLPADRHGRLLCSFCTTTTRSSHPLPQQQQQQQLWVSLLEKAYMKVMGGYDFPGSNSGIDLHALTGWIPERQAIGGAGGGGGGDNDKLFRRLMSHHHQGNVLATVATGEMAKSLADKSGLVPCHAYAVLDIREVQGVRLLLLKNPWSHVRWRGRYSELDTTRWTEQLRRQLHYDPGSAAHFDNGVFWIDYASVLHYFDTFYFSWRPQLFPLTHCYHSVWQAGQGPVRDNFNIGENPQYLLKVRCSSVVWLLLTRHITDIGDFRNNCEFITLVVYEAKEHAPNCRVFYPNDPPPFLEGVRINSPHYLCQWTVPPGAGGRGDERCFTLVVAQYEKLRTIYYTLRAFSATPFSLQPLPPLPVRCQKSGVWNTHNAGGCSNNPLLFRKNPVYRLLLTSAAEVTLQLKGPKEYQVGMELIGVDDTPPAAGHSDPNHHQQQQQQHSRDRRCHLTTNPFRSGFVVLSAGRLPAGQYHVTVCTFLAGQTGPYLLSVLSPQQHCCHLTAVAASAGVR